MDFYVYSSCFSMFIFIVLSFYSSIFILHSSNLKNKHLKFLFSWRSGSLFCYARSTAFPMLLVCLIFHAMLKFLFLDFCLLLRGRASHSTFPYVELSNQFACSVIWYSLLSLISALMKSRICFCVQMYSSCSSNFWLLFLTYSFSILKSRVAISSPYLIPSMNRAIGP